MQYGNFSPYTNIVSNILRLNRTMQYGNKMSQSLVPPPLRLFKSYYVVWKPMYQTHIYYAPRQFKSYYVVWKLCLDEYPPKKLFQGLNRTMQYGNIDTQIRGKIPLNGLNRTMQYGNFRRKIQGSELSSGFKSYYVVWKPWTKPPNIKYPLWV